MRRVPQNKVDHGAPAAFQGRSRGACTITPLIRLLRASPSLNLRAAQLQLADNTTWYIRLYRSRYICLYCDRDKCLYVSC